MTAQAGLWVAAALAIVISIVAGFADWRRSRRTSLDEVGWVPWSLVQILGFFAATIFAILAMRS